MRMSLRKRQSSLFSHTVSFVDPTVLHCRSIGDKLFIGLKYYVCAN